MQLRTALASFLTALLLVVSCASSACRTTCSLAATSSSCHAASSASLVDMPGMTHAGPDLSALFTHTACASRLCATPAVLTAASDRTTPPQPSQVFTLLAALAPLSVPRWPEPRVSPHVPPSSPAALHITLRV